MYFLLLSPSLHLVREDIAKRNPLAAATNPPSKNHHLPSARPAPQCQRARETGGTEGEVRVTSRTNRKCSYRLRRYGRILALQLGCCPQTMRDDAVAVGSTG